MTQYAPDERSELIRAVANHVVAAKRISPRLHEVLRSKSRIKSTKYSEANRQSKTQLTQFDAFALGTLAGPLLTPARTADILSQKT